VEVLVMELTVSPFRAFGGQKTVVLTTYRRDGTPVDTPVHLAVEGDRAFIRTYGKAMKTKRLRRNPEARLSLASNGTTPAIHALLGPGRAKRLDLGVSVHARLLAGDEAKQAGRALARKYPLLQGVLIPLGHRLMRTRTLQFELIAN
jgi:PPOX class probable F420-dependent enzyme